MAGLVRKAAVSLFLCVGAVGGYAAEVVAQDAPDSRPSVKGGFEDRPFITRAGNTRIGGYAEVHLRFERVDGINEALTFDPKRFNLFTYTVVSDRVRVASELEFEEGGEEIKLEMAFIDFEIHPAFTFRGGIILSPLGRFNLSHDSPVNDLTDRPLVSTQIIPTALSEAGMGFFGAMYPTPSSRISYEFYGVNGFSDGVILSDPAGTRIAAGKGNFEDNNQRPSWVGRLAISPQPNWELGGSFHTGPYNVWKADGLTIDAKRGLTILALDWNGIWKSFELLGEYAKAEIDVPLESAIFQANQQGFYGQINAHFGRGWLTALPESVFTGVVRVGAVDFDADTTGDSHRRLTLGLNFRPHEDTVFKFDYQRNWERDPFNNEVRGASFLFSVATYF
ncbi:MAG: hypothetical protein OXI19_00570 [Gemmatimonadota bacterium]|nr:hypothetical protein [Gemmatimonadota bacterium]